MNLSLKPSLLNVSSMINIRQILIGLTVLFLGTFVYLVDRSPDQTYFVRLCSLNISLHNTVPNFFESVGNNLQSFIHVFSFILITAGLLRWPRRRGITICAWWFLTDVIFELGQRYHSLPLKLIPNWFQGIPFLENSRDYFLRGTFDVIDLAAALAGSIAAYFVFFFTVGKREDYDG